MSLTVEEFLRRFLLHVLPRRFVRIRYFGFFANRHRADNIQQARALIGHHEPLQFRECGGTSHRSSRPRESAVGACRPVSYPRTVVGSLRSNATSCLSDSPRRGSNPADSCAEARVVLSPVEPEKAIATGMFRSFGRDRFVSHPR